MTTAIKRKFLCIKPVSSIAKLRFDTEMDSLHSCYLDDEQNGVLFLSSVNGKYKFTVNKYKDQHWMLIK